MSTSREDTSATPTSPGDGDQAFPTQPGSASASVSSKVRKAQVRAALFRKLDPVRVGRFILLERLGAGAMGEIYAAYDEQLDRRVALKLVRHGSELTIKADELLLREAQALAQVSHPNVVQIYEAGTHDGRLFIAMELIRGQTLTRWLADAAKLPRPQRQREILRRFIAAGRGLEAAHAAGVAHRDFKPDNVLVSDDGRVRVVDFGLARAVVDDLTPGAPAGSGSGPRRAVDDFAHGRTVRMSAGDLEISADPDTAPTVGPFQAVGGRAVDSAVDAHPRAAAGPEDERGAEGADDTGDPVAPITAVTPGAEQRTAVLSGGRSGSPDHDSRPGPPRLRAATRLTETGTVMGTPRFMAPEQIRGAIADHRSDQFSFCVALYHALYGAFPFPGERMQELLDSMERKVIDLEHGVGVAGRVRNALRRGLSIDPSRRFPSMGELLATLEPSIRRTGGWIAGAVLLLVAAVVYLRSPSADPCGKAGDGLDRSWSPPHQLAVQAAFLRSDLPYAEVGWRGVKARLDDYARRWRGEAIGACRATYVERVQSEHVFDRRMLCLERERRHAAALVSELATGAPDAVLRGVEAAEALSAPDACGHVESALFAFEPPSPATADEVAEVREQLSRALTLERLGRAEESLVVAREARIAAERLDYPPLHAEALLEMARALDGRGVAAARNEAQELYFDALDIAEAVRHDQLAVEIWHRLVLLATRMDPGTQQAHAWWRRNAAAVRRIGNHPHLQARLYHRLGELYYRDSKYAQAADQHNRAIAAIADAPGQQVELSRYYAALAKALEPMDRVEEAIQLHERALKIAADALGSAHPHVLKLLGNYGKALEKRGRYDSARAVLEAALSGMPEAYREAHVDAGRLHAFLSDLSYTEGKLDDAAVQARRSLEIYQRAGAPEHLLAEAHVNLGNAELARKSFAAALALYRDALALRRRHLGDDHYQIGVNEGSIADALVGLGRYDEAMTHVREAERIFGRGSAREQAAQAWIRTVHGEVLVGQRQFATAASVLEATLLQLEAIGPADLGNAARAAWALARALHGLGKDPDRVRRLAEQARDQFAKLGPPEARNRDTVEQFLQRLSP
jgi:eukaryotic-like serine/threonine-protein kinase